MIHSENYENVKNHYQTLLSHHYTWIFTKEDSFDGNYEFLKDVLDSGLGKQALDLGCGSGFQTIPLLLLGYTTIGIDSSPILLDELQSEAKKRNCNLEHLKIINGDFLSYSCTEPDRKDVVVCMGDTLTHLHSLQEVEELFAQVHSSLVDGGRFLVEFRDLTKPLQDIDRFIHVRSSDRTVCTTFLEWIKSGSESDNSGCKIKVHDLVHVKKGIGAWELCKSSYQKLGITRDFCMKTAEKHNLKLISDYTERSPQGMIILCFGKYI